MTLKSNVSVFDIKITRINADNPAYTALENFVKIAEESGIIPRDIIRELQGHIKSEETEVGSASLHEDEVAAIREVLRHSRLIKCGVSVDQDGFHFVYNNEPCHMYSIYEELQSMVKAVSVTLRFTGEVCYINENDFFVSRRFILKDSEIEVYLPEDIVWTKL